MNRDESTRLAVEKLKVISELTQINDVKAICKTLIKLLDDVKPDQDLGFTGGKSRAKRGDGA